MAARTMKSRLSLATRESVDTMRASIGLSEIGKGRHLHDLPFTQRREHFLGGGKVDVEPAALVDLRDRGSVAHAVAGRYRSDRYGRRTAPG